MPFQDLLIELERLQSLLQLLSSNSSVTNTEENNSKLGAMKQSIDNIEKKISMMEVDVQDRERQWTLFLENLQVKQSYSFLYCSL